MLAKTRLTSCNRFIVFDPVMLGESGLCAACETAIHALLGSARWRTIDAVMDGYKTKHAYPYVKIPRPKPRDCNYCSEPFSGSGIAYRRQLSKPSANSRSEFGSTLKY